MSKYRSRYRELETTTIIDIDGVEKSTKIEKKLSTIRNEEPSYIKIYADMWMHFNNMDATSSALFIELATRMTYANALQVEDSQIVTVGGPIVEAISRKLGWKQRMFYLTLNKLVKSGAIRKISRGYYQINPTFAGKGHWKYDPRLGQGGIENIIAVFNFKDKTIKTQIIWGDDNSMENEEYNQSFREELGVEYSDEAVLSHTVMKPISTVADKMSVVYDYDTKKCLYCDKEYEVKTIYASKKKYCSDKCRKRYSYEQKKAKINKVEETQTAAR